MSAVLERSDTVLWTLAADGIVLHNFARHVFLELDGLGYRIWGYLDGARTVDEVVARLATGPDEEERVREVIAALAANGFVEGAAARG